MSVIITENDIRMMINRTNSEAVAYHIYNVLHSVGRSAVDGFFDIFNNMSGVFIDECLGSVNGTFNCTADLYLFSNAWEICPFYWESENLTPFDDFLLEIIESSGSEEMSTLVYDGLERLCYEIISIAAFNNPNASKYVDKLVTIPIQYQYNKYLLFREPTII